MIIMGQKSEGSSLENARVVVTIRRTANQSHKIDIG